MRDITCICIIMVVIVICFIPGCCFNFHGNLLLLLFDRVCGCVVCGDFCCFLGFLLVPGFLFMPTCVCLIGGLAFSRWGFWFPQIENFQSLPFLKFFNSRQGNVRNKLFFFLYKQKALSHGFVDLFRSGFWILAAACHSVMRSKTKINNRIIDFYL